jgi:hypothetical protein
MTDVSPLLLELSGRPTATDRPARIDRANQWLLTAWRRGWASRPSLDPALLVRKARDKTGLTELGPAELWRESLDLLTASLRGQARLNPLGRVIAHGQLVSILKNRLRLHALWRRHPDILLQPVRAPVIVVGQMRSGTTRMQRLLACDPRLAHTRFYEGWSPVPRGDARLYDDRRLRSALALRAAHLINPGFAAIHPTGLHEPDEEIGWQSISLFGSAFEAQWRIPDFVARVERMDAHDVYAEFRRILQTVAWQRRDGARLPWILKVPQFTQDLPALLATFPDARLVCVSREPEAVVGSSASLAYNQMSIQSDRADPRRIGREWLRKVALRETRMMEGLAATDRPQVMLNYDEADADWRAAMRRVYAMLDMSLTPQVEQLMAAYVARSQRRSTRRHDYDLARFGLTAGQVRAALAAPLRQAA